MSIPALFAAQTIRDLITITRNARRVLGWAVGR